MTCEQACAELHLYVDRELDAAGVLRLEAHLSDCRHCRTELEGLSGIVETLRSSRPLYDAPDYPEGEVRALIMRTRKRLWMVRALALIPAALVITVGVIAIQHIRAEGTARRFTAFAAEVHARYVHQRLPLDMVSSDPREINTWLADHLAFRFQLPDYHSSDAGARRYTLTGVRLLQFEDRDATYVSYRMNSQPISLVAAPSTRVVSAGGEIYRSGGLVFHLSKQEGFQVIAWTDQGLTYALVSETNAAPAQSCIVCHGAEADRHKIENLRRLR